MNISPISQSTQTSQTSLETLKKQETDLQNQIKKLQEQDAEKNADQIKSLEQQ